MTGVVGFGLLPIAVGVAILRYRLFDIDRVISKTLVYAALSLVLGAAYVGLVLAGQALFSSFAGGSNLAIAASTLVVAALFLPVRSRVQRFVDRRFYRRRYDAQRTLEGFGARLREQVDLGTLERDLQAVVTETMQPAHVVGVAAGGAVVRRPWTTWLAWGLWALMLVLACGGAGSCGRPGMRCRTTSSHERHDRLHRRDDRRSAPSARSSRRVFRQPARLDVPRDRAPRRGPDRRSPASTRTRGSSQEPGLAPRRVARRLGL